MNVARKQRGSRKENENKKYTYNQNRKRQLTFYAHIIRKEGLQNVTLTAYFIGKKRQGGATGHVPEEVV